MSLVVPQSSHTHLLQLKEEFLSKFCNNEEITIMVHKLQRVLQSWEYDHQKTSFPQVEIIRSQLRTALRLLTDYKIRLSAYVVLTALEVMLDLSAPTCA